METDGKNADRAVQSALKSIRTFCKFLSANDAGATSGHQDGILISVFAKDMLFPDFQEALQNTDTPKRTVEISWQGEPAIESIFTWYSSKREFRLTGMKSGAKRKGRKFDFLIPERTGSLFVLTQQDYDNYSGFFLDTDEEINQFLDTFAVSPSETNALINTEQAGPGIIATLAINEFIESLNVDFPSSSAMSEAARNIEERARNHREHIKTNPDGKIISWINMEYTLFRALEHSRYDRIIQQGFTDMEEFVIVANQVLNRRKSRAGKSLEHHLAALFDENGLSYETQVITEERKRPDFLFPSEAAYHNPGFPEDRLVMLAAKTTCKDRWRQILNEADRLRDRTKYLCTLQQGISPEQMDEMQKEKVILVVPEPYIDSYSKDRRDRIWTLKRFIEYVRELERTERTERT